ncbi:Pr6Pr family membrane protein [Streptomyces lavendulocolor]|uniref:Pr6Pr family membrane protein n=1 Tax=Streptomyces lavendulocolor TaxID=67316 RepID=UPI003C30C9D3
MTAPFSTHVPASAVVPPVRRPYAAAFRLLIAAAAVTGIVIDLTLAEPARVLSYFTIQSNLLLATVLALSARRAWSGHPPLPPRVTTGAVLLITITGLVYHLLLADAAAFSMTGAQAGPHAVANQLLHTVTPLGALLDWLLLTLPGGLRPRDAALWLLCPLAYLIFALTRGALLSPGTPARYPYPFLDVTAHGYPGVLQRALVLGLLFYALALALITLDRIRPSLRARENRISSPGAGGLK